MKQAPMALAALAGLAVGYPPPTSAVRLAVRPWLSAWLSEGPSLKDNISYQLDDFDLELLTGGWLGTRDSNPDLRIQNPLSYH